MTVRAKRVARVRRGVRACERAAREVNTDVNGSMACSSTNERSHDSSPGTSNGFAPNDETSYEILGGSKNEIWTPPPTGRLSSSGEHVMRIFPRAIRFLTTAVTVTARYTHESNLSTIVIASTESSVFIAIWTCIALFQANEQSMTIPPLADLLA